MRILLLLILYPFSFSEQKPLAENNPYTSTDTVPPVIPIDHHLESDKDSSSTTVESIHSPIKAFGIKNNSIADSDKSNIFKIPLKKPGIDVGSTSTVPTTSNVAREETEERLYGKNDSVKAETTSEKTVEYSTRVADGDSSSSTRFPWLNEFNSSIRATTESKVTEPSNVGPNVENGLIDSTLPIPSLTEEVIEVEGELSGLELLVIPITGEDRSSDHDPTNTSDALVSTSTTDISDVDSTPSDVSIEILSLSVSEDDAVTPASIPSSIQNEERSTSVDYNDKFATTKPKNGEEQLENHTTSSKTTEILLAEETSFEVTPENTIGERTTVQSNTLSEKMNSSVLTSTLVSPILTRAEDSLEEGDNNDTTIHIYLTAENSSSTSTTESTSLEKVIVEAESFIQDLLDPAIVLAKRSLRDEDTIESPVGIKTQKDINADNRSRSRRSYETQAADADSNEAFSRVRRATWNEYAEDWQRPDNYGWQDYQSPASYRHRNDYIKKRYDDYAIDNSESRSPPFKLIPIFSG